MRLKKRSRITWSRWWRLFTGLYLLSLLAMGAGSLGWRLFNATKHLDQLLVQALTQTLHRPVRVGTVSVLSPGRIVVRGLAIAEGASFRDGTLLSAPETVVAYRLSDLIRGRVDPVGSIVSIDVNNPAVLVVRYADNRFNLQELFPAKKEPPKPTTFRGIVRIHNATGVFRDFGARGLPAPQENTLHRLDATLDAGGPPLMVIGVTAQGDGARVSAASTEGTYNFGTGALRLRIRAASNDAAYWSRYFARLNGLSVVSGRGSVTVDVWKPRQLDFTTAAINVGIQDGVARTYYARVPLTGVAGSIVVRSGHPLTTTLDLAGYAQGMPLRVDGAVLAGSETRVALNVAASNVTLPALGRVLGGVPSVPGATPLAPAAVTAQVYGPAGRIVAVGHAALPRARLYHSILTNVQTDFRYQDRVVTLPNVSGIAGGKTVTARGRLDLASKRLALSADVAGVSIAALGLSQLPLTGQVSSTVEISGTTTAPIATAVVTATRGRFRNIPFQRLAARVGLSGRTIAIRQAVATLEGATVFASGTATTTGSLDLAVQATGIQLDRLLASAGYPGTRGTGFFNGHLSGSTSSPVVQGKAQIFNAQFQRQKLDFASGALDWSDGRLRLSQVRVARYPAQGTVNGTAVIRPGQPVALDFAARLTTARLESLLADAGLPPVAEGELLASAHDILIGGTADAPDVRGQVALANGAVEGYPVDHASARFHYTKGRMEASDVEAASETARLRAPSLQLRDGQLSAPHRFSASGIQLARFPRLGDPYARLEGTVDVEDGSLGGTTAAPSVAATVRVRPLTVNGVAFTAFTARGRFAGKRIALSEVQLERDGGVVSMPGGAVYNFANGGFRGGVRVANLHLNDIVSLLERSQWFYTPAARRVHDAVAGIPRQSSDAVLNVDDDAQLGRGLSFGGSLKDVSVAGLVELNNVNVGGQALRRVGVAGRLAHAMFAEGRLVAGAIDIPAREGTTAGTGDETLAESADAEATGQFHGDIGGNIRTARLDAANVPLAVLRPFLPASPEWAIDGAATLDVQATGPVDAPRLEASITGEDIHFGRRKTPVDVRTGAITLENTASGPLLTANAIRVLAAGNRLDVRGSVPVTLSPPGLRSDGPLQVTADLKVPSVGGLVSLLPPSAAGAVTAAQGSASAHLDVGGTTAKPSFTGYLRAQDGMVAPKILATQIRNINADVTFAGSSLTVNRLSADSSDKGSVAAVPGGTVQVNVERRAVTPNLSFRFNGFRLVEAPGGILGERASATLTTADNSPILVSVRRSGRPEIHGTLTVSDVDLLPPNQTPAANGPSAPPRFLPGFDLTVVAGRNVVIRNPRFRIRMDEKARVQDRSLRITGVPGGAPGSAREFSVVGRLTSHEGVFNFPTARFALTAADIGIRYPALSGFNAGAADVSPFTVRADAQARLQGTVNNRRQPVTVFMHIEGPGHSALGGDQSSPLAAISDYRITLRSTPSLSERQLLALIDREEAINLLAQGATTQDVLRDEALNIVQASLLPEALSGFEGDISRAFGLESLTLDYLSTDRALSVTATKRIGSHIVLTYTRPFGSTTGGDVYALSAAYEITPFLRLTLQQQKGPFLFGVPSTSLPGVSPTLRETTLLLDGSFPF